MIKKLKALELGSDVPSIFFMHRSASIVAALKAYMIVRAVFDQMALRPGTKLESHIATVMKSHHVSRNVVFRALRQLDPERKRQMLQAAVISKAWKKRLSITN
jgi:hypothetical protein